MTSAVVATTPLTEQADDLQSVWSLFFWIAVGVGALVAALCLFVVFRYRRRADALPTQTREHIPLEVMYTVVPFLVVAGLFAVTVGVTRSVDGLERDGDSDSADLVVEVVGFQWQWQFTYPESGVAVIGSDSVVPELVLPAGSSVRFEMTSSDVIHSFWIPGFRFKRDVFPGETTEFAVDVADEHGTWDSGVCAEFCGIDHHRMRFSVSIVTAAEFDAWVDAQLAAQSGPPTSPPPATTATSEVTS